MKLANRIIIDRIYMQEDGTETKKDVITATRIINKLLTYLINNNCDHYSSNGRVLALKRSELSSNFGKQIQGLNWGWSKSEI